MTQISWKCIPYATGGSITSDTCFLALLNGQFLKGRATKTQVFAAGADLDSDTPRP